MASDCVFCRIVAGKIPSEIVHQDEALLAFRDIEPQAPKHIIIIPKTHITSLAEVTTEQQEILSRLMILAQKLAEDEGIARSGYRVVINCGSQGGQVIPHLHLHLIGGRKLSDQLG